MLRHSGAARSAKPGIHNHNARSPNSAYRRVTGGYGFRARAFGAPRNDSARFS